MQRIIFYDQFFLFPISAPYNYANESYLSFLEFLFLLQNCVKVSSTTVGNLVITKLRSIIAIQAVIPTKVT